MFAGYVCADTLSVVHCPPRREILSLNSVNFYGYSSHPCRNDRILKASKVALRVVIVVVSDIAETDLFGA